MVHSITCLFAITPINGKTANENKHVESAPLSKPKKHYTDRKCINNAKAQPKAPKVSSCNHSYQPKTVNPGGRRYYS